MKNDVENMKWDLSYILSFCKKTGYKMQKRKKMQWPDDFDTPCDSFHRALNTRHFCKHFCKLQLSVDSRCSFFSLLVNSFIVSLLKPWNFISKICNFNYSDSVDTLLPDENMDEP